MVFPMVRRCDSLTWCVLVLCIVVEDVVEELWWCIGVVIVWRYNGLVAELCIVVMWCSWYD